MRARTLVTALFLAVLGLAGAPDAAASQPPRPSATIGPARCLRLTVDVTLDNTAMPTATTFRVLLDAEDGQPFLDRDVEVAAGQKQALTVPLPGLLRVFVRVVVPGGTDQSRAFKCATLPALRADIGELDCSTLTIPVTLINPRRMDYATFDISVSKTSPHRPFWDATFNVPAGESPVINVPLADHSSLMIEVMIGGTHDEIAGNILDVDCDVTGTPTSRPSRTPRPTQPTRPARPDGQLPRTGALPDSVLLVGLALVLSGAVLRVLAKSRD